MDCSSTVAKYLVFIFNFLFFLAGVGLIVVGALAKTHNQSVYQDVFTNAPDLSGVAIICIVVGCIVTVISFFGCCGAIRESSCMLNTFAILLALIVLAQLAVAIAALVLKGNVKDLLNDSIKSYPTDSDVKWDQLQNKLQCCGVDSYTDWSQNPLYGSTQLPTSCCSSTTIITGCTTSSTTIYQTGCYDAMSGFYIAIGAVGIVLGLIEIIGVVFACCLSKAVRYSTK